LASNLIPAIFKLHVAAIKRTESWSLRLGSRQKLRKRVTQARTFTARQ
jgi:hypothetical protein